MVNFPITVSGELLCRGMGRSLFKMKILLFVSSNCPHCPLAESVLREVAPNYSNKGLIYEKIRTKTTEGKELSEKYFIRGTPTMLFLDGKDKEIERIIGSPSEEKLKKKIEKLLGLKKSFLNKFRIKK